MHYDMVLTHGNILTMEKQGETAQWLAVSDGKIADVGQGAKPPLDATRVIDLKGSTVLPGLIDSHVHGTLTGIYLSSVNVRDARTVSDVLERIETACSSQDGESWILCAGLLPQNLKEKRPPNRWELDAVSCRHPVFVDYVTYHGCLVNSKALAGLSFPSGMTGIEFEHGEPNGTFNTDESVFYVRACILGDLDDEVLKSCNRACADHATSRGVTTIHTLDGQFVQNDKDIYLWLEEKEALPLHVINFFQTWQVERVRDLGLPRIGGCLTLDGSLFEHSEAMDEAYVNRPETRGILYHSDEEVYKLVTQANRARLQVAMHAGGTRAIDQLIFVYNQVIGEQGDFDLRHRIEHFCQPTERHFELARKLNLAVCMQPMFSYLWDLAKGGPFEEHVGRKRADERDPFRKILDAGVMICGGSDSPVTEINPLLGVHACVNNPNPVRRLSVWEALKLFTTNPAWVAHEEKDKGTIRTGKLADLTVVDGDPFKISGKIDEIKVLRTLVEGKEVFSRATT